MTAANKNIANRSSNGGWSVTQYLPSMPPLPKHPRDINTGRLGCLPQETVVGVI